jgi:hypothetical protein
MKSEPTVIDCGPLPPGVVLGAVAAESAQQGPLGRGATPLVAQGALEALDFRGQPGHVYLLKSAAHDLLAVAVAVETVGARLSSVLSGTLYYMRPARGSGGCWLRLDVPAQEAPHGVVVLLAGAFEHLEWFRQLAQRVRGEIPGGVEEVDWGHDC